MIRRWRLKKAHARYLEASRNLAEGREYWGRRSLAVRILEWFSPVPLLALHEDGRRLLDALQGLEARSTGGPLAVKDLIQYHRTIGGDGEYRRGQAHVRDSRIARPPHPKVPALMLQVDSRLGAEQERLDALPRRDPAPFLQAAVELHQRLAFIHPFADGNGRVARLAMNHLLRRYGQGYVILPPLDESPEHHRAMEEAHGGNLGPLLELARRHLHPV